MIALSMDIDHGRAIVFSYGKWFVELILVKSAGEPTVALGK